MWVLLQCVFYNEPRECSFHFFSSRVCVFYYEKGKKEAFVPGREKWYKVVIFLLLLSFT